MRKTRGRCRSSFFSKEAKRPLCGMKVGVAKHLGISMMETIATLIRPSHHTAPHRKSNVWQRLASFSMLTKGGKVYIPLPM
jgi:hypothetical protein